jgi:AraC-like DNA-binding protein
MQKAKKPVLPLAACDLFDTFWMGHTCEVLGTRLREREHWDLPAFAAALRQHLLEPLELWIGVAPESGHGARDELSAAWRFHGALDRLSERLADRHFPWDDTDQDSEPACLRAAWLEFIAYGAAHHIYHGIPSLQRAARLAARAPRGNGKKLTAQDVALKFRGVAKGSHQATLQEVAQEHGVSERTVSRRYKDAREQGLC